MYIRKIRKIKINKEKAEYNLENSGGVKITIILVEYLLLLYHYFD